MGLISAMDLRKHINVSINKIIKHLRSIHKAVDLRMYVTVLLLC